MEMKLSLDDEIEDRYVSFFIGPFTDDEIGDSIGVVKEAAEVTDSFGFCGISILNVFVDCEFDGRVPLGVSGRLLSKGGDLIHPKTVHAIIFACKESETGLLDVYFGRDNVYPISSFNIIHDIKIIDNIPPVGYYVHSGQIVRRLYDISVHFHSTDLDSHGLKISNVRFPDLYESKSFGMICSSMWHQASVFGSSIDETGLWLKNNPALDRRFGV